ncbi:LacI family DNA-binding transcriptional regulator [Rhizobium mongolense]
MGKPTARDLAVAAGVSLSTVDRVLNNRGGVGEDKERRVLENARKLKIDRALNQRAARTLRIAVLLQSRANPFHAAVQDSFEAANRDFLQYNRKAGRVAGDLMGRLLGEGGGEIVVISGMLSMIGHEEREMGFRAVLRERYPQCKVAEVLESMERGERAGDLVFNALKGNPRIRGIYNASAGARSVVSAMNALGRRKEIVFITHELTDERRQLLREGLIDAIIDQDPALEVRAAVEALAAHFGRNDDPPACLTTSIHIHMIENC